MSILEEDDKTEMTGKGPKADCLTCLKYVFRDRSLSIHQLLLTTQEKFTLGPNNPSSLVETSSFNH